MRPGLRTEVGMVRYDEGKSLMVCSASKNPEGIPTKDRIPFSVLAPSSKTAEAK